MKKSILSLGGMMMLCLLVFSCTEEQENIKLNDEQVNFKGEVNKEKQEADERGAYKVAHLLTYLHRYIKGNVTDAYKYYENIPERKEPQWFSENFKNHLKSENDADNWALDKIESGEIFIIGTTVKEVKVAALIFSEGLEVPEQFKDKSGIFFDTNTPEDCLVWSEFGNSWGENCFCHYIYSCHDWGWCWPCPEDDQTINLDDLLDLDQWIINDYDFEKFGSLPVSEINIGDPVLQVKRK